MQGSRQLANDLVIDIMADSVAHPLASSKSVIYTAAQQFLLAPGEGTIGLDPGKTLLPIQSAGSETSVVRTSQSMTSDAAAVERDQQAQLLLGASVPTTENLAQLQQHQSAAEEDLIRAHPVESPRSTFWGKESRYSCKLWHDNVSPPGWLVQHTQGSRHVHGFLMKLRWYWFE